MVLDLYKGEGAEKGSVKAKKNLTKYANDFARAAIQKYWELGDKFWIMFKWGF
jgi:dipeptidase